MLAPIQFQTAVPTGDLFALSIAAGRDLDGDGGPDLLVADSTPRDGSVVWSVSARDGSVLSCLEVPGASWTACVEMLGDIDHDGRSEFAVGDRQFHLEILSGKDAQPIATIRGEELGVRIGHVRAAGRVDEDQVPDMVVSGAGPIGSREPMASACVLSGRDGCAIWRLIDEDSDCKTKSMASVAGVGDIDGDGRDDVAVGWMGGGFRRSGRVVLYSGKTGSLLLSLDRESLLRAQLPVPAPR